MKRTPQWILITSVTVIGLWACLNAADKPAGKKVAFKMTRVGTFRSESCEVGDFNGDGKLDIVAGPYWYEAPTWKPHKYRTLRGKVDDKGKGY
jgi:hypothetical protein